MGRTKRYIYTEWLPGSGYEPSEIIGDFELHDHRSLGKKPEVNLYVAVKEKNN
jgi:predicted transcriptional regulator YdeE